MEAMRAIPTECGVLPERVQKELFGGPPTPRVAEAAPEWITASVGARVVFSRASRTVGIPGDQPIGGCPGPGVSIPYSCRQGQCGTCATRPIADEVRMDAEAGLAPELRRQGYVLTCVGRAVGEVTLEA